MGFFFACFRIRGSDRRKAHPVSKSIASKNSDPLVTKNQLASLFQCEDHGGLIRNLQSIRVFIWKMLTGHEKGSPSVKVKHLSLQQNFDREIADEELVNEATPVEIREASEKTILQSPSNDGVASNFCSRLPDTSCKTLHWDEQSDHLSNTPTKINGNAVQLDGKPGSCCFEENRTLRKIVQFDEGVGHISGSLNLSPQTDNQIQQLGSNGSPYPTSLSLSEGMYIPGKAYTPKSTGNDTRTQTQHVYPVLNPVQNLSQMKELREGALPGQSNDGEKSQQISLMSSPEISSYDKRSQDQLTNFKEEADINQETPKLIVSSLSQWLKPPLSIEERRKNKISDTSPAPDRPIIGLVATHWNENEPTRVSPKWFDGNGIPNSTNKYKEDQKVSWHVTPFEERLEKALSDEKLFPRRQPSGGSPGNLDEEESDTAASCAYQDALCMTSSGFSFTRHFQ